MVWWLNVLMVLNAGGILDFLHIQRIIQKSKQGSAFVANPWSNSFDRVLLATIRDKGLSPCPRCLVPKSKLDQTGTKRDSNFRLKNVRTYLFDYVQIARNAIYNSAAAIAGTVVNRLLKPTSSVPTLVSKDIIYGCSLITQILSRMHLLISLALILISPACSSLIFCMNLSWESGKPFLPT
jgi:hypothetical protein